MFEILKSLLIVTTISVGIAGVGYTMLGTNFVGIFIISVVIQLALGWFIKTYSESAERKLIIEQQSNLITQIDQEANEAPCAYCGEINLIPILPGADNDFDCLECGKTNSVYVNITIAQKTVPIDAQPYEITNFNENLQNAKNKLLSDERS